MKTKNLLPPAVFIAGAMGLDFLNSLARPVDEDVDWLSNGSDFLSWMQQAKLLSIDDLAMVKSKMSARELDRVSAKARDLREWLRSFVTEHMGRPLKGEVMDELGPLQEILALDEMFCSLAPAETSLAKQRKGDKSPTVIRLRMQRRWRKPDSLLLPIAEEIAKLISSANFRYVKGCDGHNCILFFLDQTSRHGRRWCSMAICGNRAKQDAHQVRLKKRKSAKKHRQ
jgi:predicted RNA-binding Zn ribbon-like protein